MLSFLIPLSSYKTVGVHVVLTLPGDPLNRSALLDLGSSEGLLDVAQGRIPIHLSIRRDVSRARALTQAHPQQPSTVQQFVLRLQRSGGVCGRSRCTAAINSDLLPVRQSNIFPLLPVHVRFS